MSIQTKNVTFNEHDRQQLAQELATDHGPSWTEAFKPGSFGCHELLDRSNMIGDLVEENILNHPSCVQNPEWYALADQAVTALRELYQRIGAIHLAPMRRPTVSRPTLDRFLGRQRPLVIVVPHAPPMILSASRARCTAL